MLIAKCPTCGDAVSVRANLTPQTRISCPLCHDEFTAGLLLSQIPPEVQVVDQSGIFDGEPDLVLEQEAELPDRPAVDRPSFDFDVPESHPTASASVSQKPLSSFRPPPRRRSPLNEGIKIVLGGAVGLVIAQLILWWLPEGYRRDPLQLAPRLPDYVAFLAPASLRGSTITPVNDPTSSTNGPPSGKSNLESLPPLDGSFGANPDRHPVTPADDPLDETVVGSDTLPEDSAADYQEPRDESVDALLGIRDAPTFSKLDLNKRLTEAQAALTAFSGDVETERRAAAQELYRALCRLAHHITFVDPTVDIAEPLEQIDKIMRGIADFKWMGGVAGQWMRKTDRDTDGIILEGTVEAIRPVGLYFETEVRLPGVATPVTIVGKEDPTKLPHHPVHEGDEVILMGHIVSDPSLNVLGYPGIEDPIVWGGYVFVRKLAASGS